MKAGDLYQWVMAGPDIRQAVASLNARSLCMLTGWLAQDFDENDRTGEVLGFCLVEATRRFIAEHGEEKS